jgi:predicted nucleic acid-binding protein
MMLVDTSVWIDFLGGRDTEPVALLDRAIREREALALCGVVLTEVLQGIREDAQHRTTKGQLALLTLLPMDVRVFLLAADIYRALRKRGITIRRTNDCLIAAVALTFDVPLLHADVDFDRIARVFPLRAVEA